MKICIGCGNRNNRDQAKWCDQCGSALPATSATATAIAKSVPVKAATRPPMATPTATPTATPMATPMAKFAPINTETIPQPAVDRRRRFQLPRHEDLTKEQDLAYELPKEGRHLLIGGPGTGKSVIALLRMKNLSKNKPDFLAYNRLLIHYCRTLAPVLISANTWITWFKNTFREQTGKACPMHGQLWEINWAGVTDIIAQIEPDKIAPPASPYLVIDEGQDMPKAFYWTLSDLGYEHIFVAADFNQVLHPERSSNRRDLIDALEKKPRQVVTVNESKERLFDPGAIIELQINHRNSKPIARLAAHICNALNHQQNRCTEFRDDMRDATTPILFGYDPNNPQRDRATLCRWIILTADRYPRWLIGIFCLTKQMRDEYKQVLDDALAEVRHRLDHDDPRIERLDMSQGQGPDFTQGGILVLTAQSCKGLEFDFVFIADIDVYRNNTANHQLFYVMVTRAIERLVLLHDRTKPCPIASILPQDPNLLKRDH